MKYKIGDYVVYIDKALYYYRGFDSPFSLYGKIAKVVNIEHKSIYPYQIEFKEWINGHNADGKGKQGHCIHADDKEIKSLAALKLKKFLTI